MNSAIPYRADVDGLRAIAVATVVGYHAFPGRVPGGFIGVDVFFVISGFLISGILLRGLDEGRFSLTEFYGRRIRRIFPALAVVLLACLAFGWFALFAGEYAQLGKHTAAGAGFVSNWVLWDESGYFDNEAETKPLLHLWSLGIEEQFYLVWPLLIAAAWRLRFNPLLLIGVIGCCSFVINVALVHDNVVATFYGPATRVWELALGGALACLMLRRQAVSLVDVRLGHVLSCAGAALIAAASFSLDRLTPFPGWWALLPTVGAALIIAAGPRAWFNQGLAWKPIVALGLISYPLYLWHWALLSFLRIVESAPPALILRVGAVAVSVVLACLTYVIVERPIRFGGRRPLTTAAVSAVLAAVGLAGYVVFKNGGFGYRLAAYEDQLRVINTVVESTPDCKTLIPVSTRYCMLADASKAPTVALIGDSHANRLFGPLSEKYRAEGENLVQLGGGGCLPFWDVRTGEQGEPNRCDAMMPTQLDWALASPSVRKVILLNRGPWFIEGNDLYYKTRSLLENVHRPRDTDRLRVYGDALRETVARFARAGKAVLVVIDSPEFSYDPKTCLDLERPFASPFRQRPDCRIPRADVDARNRAYVHLSAAAVRPFPAASVVNFQDALCDAEYCYGVLDGKLLYRDADHLNEYGTRYVMGRLGRRF